MVSLFFIFKFKNTINTQQLAKAQLKIESNTENLAVDQIWKLRDLKSL